MKADIAEKPIMRMIAVVLGIMMAASNEHAFAAARPISRLDSKTGRVVLTNGRLELVIETKGGLDPCSLRDLKSGRIYADADYAWPNGVRPTLVGTPVITEKDGICSVVLKGGTDSLEIEQTFSASAAEPDIITEQIKLHNPGTNLVETPSFACGFTKKIHDDKDWLPGIADSHFCDVPYRRHPETGELCDYTVRS